MLFFAYGGPAVDGGDTGIGVDAAQLEELQPRLLHLCSYPVIQAAFFNRAPAVAQQHALAVSGQLRAQMMQLAGAKVNFGGNIINK